MESRIPLPTDNVYKFYSLFGILLIIFSLGSTVYVSSSTNELILDTAIEYHSLENDPARTSLEEAQYLVLKKKIDIAKSNKFFYMYFLGGVLGMGIILAWYGFKKWHREIQPVQDEIAKLTLLKLKKELGIDEDA